MKERGFFGVAIYHGKHVQNVGSLWRTADLCEAQFICTIGHRYKKQPTDTFKTWRHTPLFGYSSFEEFKKALPLECKLIGIELTEESEQLKTFKHPERAIYLLGAEDHGLPTEILKQCHNVVSLKGRASMNVAVAGSIVIYHRKYLNHG